MGTEVTTAAIVLIVGALWRLLVWSPRPIGPSERQAILNGKGKRLRD